MEITFLDQGINGVVLDNLYSDEQVRLIKKELKYFTEAHKLNPPEHTGSARLADGSLAKKNKGVFLDDVYKDVRYSDIIINALRTYRNDEICAKFIKHNPMWKIYKYLNSMSTLVSYYEESDYYEAHRDHSVFTIVSYFFDEPKSFEGGSIILHSEGRRKKVEIEIRNNRAVIFPSCVEHEVVPVKMTKATQPFGGQGRYCVSHFCSMLPDNMINKVNF
jgi:hypothetical protein